MQFLTGSVRLTVGLVQIQLKSVQIRVMSVQFLMSSVQLFSTSLKRKLAVAFKDDREAYTERVCFLL